MIIGKDQGKQECVGDRMEGWESQIGQGSSHLDKDLGAWREFAMWIWGKRGDFEEEGTASAKGLCGSISSVIEVTRSRLETSEKIEDKGRMWASWWYTVNTSAFTQSNMGNQGKV